MKTSQILRRIPIALLVGVVIAAISFYSVWLGVRDVPRLIFEREFTINDMGDIASTIAAYQQKHGKLPASLEDLLEIEGNGRIRQDDLRDRWGRPFLYSVEGQEYTLASLGRDGRPGGIGPDWDLSITGPGEDALAVLWKAQFHCPEARPTFRQFLLEVRPARRMAQPCLLTGLLAAVLTACLLKSPRILVKDVIAIVFTVAFAMFLSWFMAAIHIPSGH